jgi:hypothetical protein
MMEMLRALVLSLILISCGVSSSFHLGQRPIIPYSLSTTALQMANDEKAREEAVAKYIAKANEETIQALKKLEQEKDEQVRELQQKLADLLKAKSNNLAPPIVGSNSLVDSTLRQQEIELEALKQEVQELKRHVAASSLERRIPPVTFSNIGDDSYSDIIGEEVQILRLRLATLQDLILNANDFGLATAIDNFSMGSRTEMADELRSLRLRLARLKDELVERLGDEQQYPPSTPKNTVSGQELPPVEKQLIDFKALGARLDDLLQTVFGRGQG